MVKLKIFILVIGAVFFMFGQLTPAIGQTTSSDVSKEAKEAWETFKAYLAHQKDEAVAEGKILLKKADAKIQQMEGDAAKASGDAKVEYEKTIKNLKEMRAHAANKLDDLGNSSSDAWDATKDGFVEAYKYLYDAYKEAVSKFK